MATRTTRTSVTFLKPFTLGDFDEVLPPGNYAVDTDEDLIQGLSFSAYMRVSVVVHLPSKSGKARLSRALTIDPHELDAALMRDQGSGEMSVRDGSDRETRTSSADRLAIEVAENEGMVPDAPWP